MLYMADEPEIPLTENVVEPEQHNIPVEQAYPHIIRTNSTLFSVLRGLGVSPQDIQEIVTAARPHFNLAQIQPGTRFQLFQESNPVSVLNGIKFRFSPIEMLEVKKQGDTWAAKKITENVDIKVVTFSGRVQSSLWESAERAEMDPNLISELSEIFGWQVDFAREVRINDRWRLSVERKFVRNEAIGWGSILAAEYENAGELHVAVLHRKDGKDLGYFSPDGASLRRMFLKSPIKFGRISSRFTKKRFHPVLQVNRPHLGVDYAAPIGTPVRAVGDGVITFAGWRGGGGKTIKIRHNSIYETAYKHLNGYAKGIRNGARVRQGDTIGYVGNTGLSTGPHLHFEFYQAGRFVDPLGKKFPTAEPVPKSDMAQFKSEAVQLLGSLPPWESVLDISARQMASDPAKTANSETVISR